MIFTSVFGFANMPRAFYLMGYGAIPWYVLSALAFFIPYAFMMAEYGAAFKDEKGGIYSWMEKSVGPKYAFVGTFMWYASYIIWMVSVSSGLWVPLSNALFGKDTTAGWSLFGLNSVQTLGVLAVCWMLVVTFFGSKGLDKITKVTSVGGTAITLLNLVLLVGALLVLVLNKGQFAQPLHSISDFVSSPNPDYQSTISSLSFIVFAIFAYGGIEVVGGLVDQTENAEVTFPKGVSMAAIIIAVGYSVGIFLCGIFIDWKSVLGAETVHMGNASYVIMQNLGYEIGQALHLTESVSLGLGAATARFMGISMFLALTGAFFTLTFAPLKQLMEGTPNELWPGKLGETKNGIPVFGMWVQCIIVCVMVISIAFGGDKMAAFFKILTLMTNVAMTIPYMFLAFAFISFKNKESINKPFEVYKSKGFTYFMTMVVVFAVGFANVFTIIEPLTKNEPMSTVWMLAGPIFFTIVSIVLYTVYENKYVKKNNRVA